MSLFAQGTCGAVVTNLGLVAVGPAVSHLVPPWFYVIPVGGVGVSAIGRDEGCDDRRRWYGGAHRCKHLLYVLYGLGERSVGGDEALDGGIFLN